MGHDAATRWRQALQAWGIPAEILEQAPRSPWIHPTESFRPTGDLSVATPSRRRALDALKGISRTPSVLDVGCGGGRAVFGLVPPTCKVVGVDRQQSMLKVFAEEATARGAESATILGEWPDVAHVTPRCDVVVCHHVFFNVEFLEPFAAALGDHAACRVVVEMTLYHPLSNLSDAWKRFWLLERPKSPTAHDALAVLHQMGIDANYEQFSVPDPKASSTEVSDRDIEHTRVRLCLPASRDGEVREFLEHRPREPRAVATIWWDT